MDDDESKYHRQSAGTMSKRYSSMAFVWARKNEKRVMLLSLFLLTVLWVSSSRNSSSSIVVDFQESSNEEQFIDDEAPINFDSPDEEPSQRDLYDSKPTDDLSSSDDGGVADPDAAEDPHAQVEPKDLDDLTPEQLYENYEEMESCPFLKIPKVAKKKKEWWQLRNYYTAYSTNPVKTCVPVLRKNIRLTMENFRLKFRRHGQPVVFDFESLRDTGFTTQAFTIAQLQEKYPYNSSDAPGIVQAYQANGRRDDELDLGPALVSIMNDGALSKKKNTRNFPRNMKVKEEAIHELGIQPPPLIPDISKYQTPSLWMGTSSSGTRFHHDCCDNFVMMITGTKRFTLAPTTDWHPLKPQCIGKRSSLCWANIEDPGKADTSHINKIIIDVKPGQILYMPAGWFHHIENLGPTVMVNVWTKSSQTIGLNKVY